MGYLIGVVEDGVTELDDEAGDYFGLGIGIEDNGSVY